MCRIVDHLARISNSFPLGRDVIVRTALNRLSIVRIYAVAFSGEIFIHTWGIRVATWLAADHGGGGSCISLIQPYNCVILFFVYAMHNCILLGMHAWFGHITSSISYLYQESCQPILANSKYIENVEVFELAWMFNQCTSRMKTARGYLVPQWYIDTRHILI